MASVSMAMPIGAAAAKNRLQPPNSDAFFNPLRVKQSFAKPVVACTKSKLKVEASLKEKAVAGITSAAVAASLLVPEVAQAADSLTPSLKNFILSLGAGGIVLIVIAGAVVGVSNFDPVKRG